MTNDFVDFRNHFKIPPTGWKGTPGVQRLPRQRQIPVGWMEPKQCLERLAFWKVHPGLIINYANQKKKPTKASHSSMACSDSPHRGVFHVCSYEQQVRWYTQRGGVGHLRWLVGRVSFHLMSPESQDWRDIHSYLFPTLRAPTQFLGIPEEDLELSSVCDKPWGSEVSLAYSWVAHKVSLNIRTGRN